MLVAEDLRSGDAVICIPRDLFKEGAVPSSPVFPGGSQGPQEEEDNRASPTSPTLQGLRLLLPVVSSFEQYHRNSSLPFPSTVPHHAKLAFQDSKPDDLRTRGSNDPSSALSLATGISDCAAARQWSFQTVASLRSNPSSLASDVIAAIDFDETGSLFATGGIARKIRVCSYAAILDDHPQPEAFREIANDETDCFDEENRFSRPHGKGRSYLNSRPCKRKIPAKDHEAIKTHDESALRILTTPAKLSSLKWRKLGSGIIGCGDYDGVVTEWDVEQGLCLCERYEHSGQRIWSVDYSSCFPTLCGSASGDGTVRLWTLNCEKSIGVIRSPGRNSICCAEFSSDGPLRVAVACADSNVYLYDVRRLDSSLLCLEGHERAASYVRFLGGDELVSASIDSSIMLWNVSSSNALGTHRRGLTSRGDVASRIRPLHRERDANCWQSARKLGKDEMQRLLRTFNSHVNVKNFVGLSVWKESGLIACGSESNELYVYNKNKNEPVLQLKFPTGCSQTQWRCAKRDEEVEDNEEGKRMQKAKSFVGAVCWQEQKDHHALVAANSEGTLQLLKVNQV